MSWFTEIHGSSPTNMYEFADHINYECIISINICMNKQPAFLTRHTSVKAKHAGTEHSTLIEQPPCGCASLVMRSP